MVKWQQFGWWVGGESSFSSLGVGSQWVGGCTGARVWVWVRVCEVALCRQNGARC